MSNESKCPSHHGAGTGTTNRDWWPKQLRLDLLHRHGEASDPMAADFDAARVAHAILYIAGIPGLRTVSWAVSLVGFGMIVSRLFG